MASSAEGLGAVDQRLVVVGGEEEAAASRVLEVREQGLGQLDERIPGRRRASAPAAAPAVRRAGTRSRRGRR
ncbi:MAG: hypothetical protein MZV65_19365 [Chromatiales bacterium]|nr:hypothetical protein [Chromatiales bacterium]